MVSNIFLHQPYLLLFYCNQGHHDHDNDTFHFLSRILTNLGRYLSISSFPNFQSFSYFLFRKVFFNFFPIVFGKTLIFLNLLRIFLISLIFPLSALLLRSSAKLLFYFKRVTLLLTYFDILLILLIFAICSSSSRDWFCIFVIWPCLFCERFCIFAICSSLFSNKPCIF